MALKKHCATEVELQMACLLLEQKHQRKTF
jgi:hypothetical protein